MPDGETANARGAERLSALRATAVARERQLTTRVAIALVGSVFLYLDAGFVAPSIALGLLLLFQIIDTMARRRLLLREGRTEPVTAWELALVCACNVLAAGSYSSIAVVAWFAPDPGFQIFAGFWLLGSMLHVILHMHHERWTFFASFLPHASLVFLLPIFGVAFGQNTSPLVTAALLYAGTLFLAHLATAFTTYYEKSRELRDARQQAEERRKVAEAASQAKSRFLATLSHEIRTPMNGIIGMAAVLEEADLPEDARQQVEVMRQASDLLLVLLNDVLDMSKIEAGRITLDEQPFSLRSIAERAASLHAAEAERRGLTMAVEISDGVADRRLGDEHRLLQILHNLVGNAVKFTEQGAIHLKVGEDEEGRVLLSVIDSGIGMTVEEAERVFEPFTQADGSTTRQYGGTGLGLTITKGLIELMGGQLRLETEKGRGSTFTVTLPLPEAAEIATPPTDSREPSANGLEGLRVLAVDDNEVNLQVLESMLRPAGVHLVLATSGAQGIELFRAADYDIVLLDISMPHLDGPEVLSRMREERGDEAMPPVLAVSAHAMPDDIASFMASGFDGHVAKPIRRHELLRAVRGAVAKAREAAA